MPISVLVVDDSVVVRRLIVKALEDDAEIEILGTASNGQLALQRLEQGLPDVVTLDIEMPVVDGLETMREIRKKWPRLPVIMFSTLTEKGASATLEALSSGARDYVTKPANVGSVTESLASVRQQLLPKIKALAGRRGAAMLQTPDTARPPLPGQRATPPVLQPSLRPPTINKAPTGAPPGRVDVLAIGCSTGGPEALTSVLKALPGDLSVPIVVVQHMPPVFTKLFADRLNIGTSFQVHEAEAGMTLVPGHVYVAPGDFHLVVEGRGALVRTALNSKPPENFCRPAVDPLFRSVAAVYGAKALAVVLTGMGSDGRLGAEALKAAGAHVVAQDEATSVVWGMPGAVAGAGLADRILPLGEIAPYVLRALRPKAAGVAPATSGGLK